MTNVNISLPEDLKNYLEEQATCGGYGTTSDYERELIREDKKRKAHEQDFRLKSLIPRVQGEVFKAPGVQRKG